MTDASGLPDPAGQPQGWGSFHDAERLREWAFLQRTPGQRLAWLTAALEIAYRSGALRPRRPEAQEVGAE